MILNLNEEIPEIVKDILNSPFTFYLGGKRYFGGGMCGQDWEFFTNNSSEEFINFLIEKNFKQYNPGVIGDIESIIYSSVWNIKIKWYGYNLNINIGITSDINALKITQKVLADKWRIEGKPEHEEADKQLKIAFYSARETINQLSSINSF